MRKRFIALIMAVAVMMTAVGVPAVYAAETDADVELMAANSDYIFEYDHWASGNLTRVVRVRYDDTYFTAGINSFVVEISMPSAYVADVTADTSRLVGFDINQNYDTRNNVFIISGSRGSNFKTSGGLMFNMTITLKANITSPFVISTVGSTYIGDDSGAWHTLDNGMLPISIEIPVIGEPSDTSGPLTWTYANGVLTLSGNGAMADYEMGTAPWLERADLIKSIVFTGDTVDNIGKYAFYGLYNVESVKFPEYVGIIGEGAFEGCSSLTEIEIPTSVIGIGEGAFEGCSSLTEIEIPTSVTVIGGGVFAGCRSLKTVKVPFVGSSIEPRGTDDSIFGYFFGVANGDIPDSITKVEVTRTDNEYYIPKEAFANCANIEDIIIDGGRSVLGNAFRNCKALKHLYLPKSLDTIGDTILADCEQIETLTVPFIGADRRDNNSGTSVIGGFFGWNDMGNTGTTKQYYNENGDYHYYKVPKTLKNVSVLGQTSIPVGAFSYCRYIEKVATATGTKVGKWAFYGCYNLKSVTLPGDLTRIEDEAFADCQSLETINIPAQPRKITIGSLAFSGDYAFKNITMPDNVTEIADDVFAGSNLLSLDGDAPVNVLAWNGGTITCSLGSYAYEYAKEHNIATNIVDPSKLDIRKTATTVAKLSDGAYFFDIVNAYSMDGTLHVELYDKNNRLLRDEMQPMYDVENRIEFTNEEMANVEYAKIYITGTRDEFGSTEDEILSVADGDIPDTPVATPTPTPEVTPEPAGTVEGSYINLIPEDAIYIFDGAFSAVEGRDTKVLNHSAAKQVYVGDVDVYYDRVRGKSIYASYDICIDKWTAFELRVLGGSDVLGPTLRLMGNDDGTVSVYGYGDKGDRVDIDGNLVYGTWYRVLIEIPQINNEGNINTGAAKYTIYRIDPRNPSMTTEIAAQGEVTPRNLDTRGVVRLKIVAEGTAYIDNGVAYIAASSTGGGDEPVDPTPTAEPTEMPTAHPTECGTIPPMETSTTAPTTTPGSGTVTNGTDKGITWEFSGDTLTITGTDAIPNYTAGGAPWYHLKDQIKTIKIEKSITAIGENNFYNLDKVTSVSVPDTLLQINAGAFEGCKALKTIPLPNEMNGGGIGVGAFKNAGITSITVPTGIRSVSQGAFEGCNSLTEITLPFIGPQVGSEDNERTFDYIFNGNVPDTLVKVTITNETKMPAGAFANLKNIQNITINKGIKSIENGAFDGCAALKSFVIPDSVTIIGTNAFRGCVSAEIISVPDTVRGMGEAAFDGCAKLAEVNIPDGVEHIYDYTFRGCSSLTNVEVPGSVDSIGKSVFEGCTRIYAMKVPFVGVEINPGNAVENGSVFGYFFGTENNNIPASVTKVTVTDTTGEGYISDRAFANCADIVDIMIDGVSSIGDEAFFNCKALKHLYIPKSISFMGDNILGDCERLESLTVPFIGKDRNDNGTETSVLGGFFGYDDDNKSGKTMQRYNDAGGYHYYKVPRSLKSVSVLDQTVIFTGAFMECGFIEKVSIVTGAEIGKQAFYNCKRLRAVTLPDNLTEIGEQAFANCAGLETINIPGQVKTIGKNAFYNATNLKNVIMPESIETIADGVFVGTNLSSSGAIICAAGSYAEEYANKNKFAVKLVDSSELNIKKTATTVALLSDDTYLFDVINAYNMRGVLHVDLYDGSNKIMEKTCDASGPDVEYRIEFTADDMENVSRAEIYITDENGKAGSTEIETLSAENGDIPEPPEIESNVVMSYSNGYVTFEGSANIKSAVLIQAVYNDDNSLNTIRQYKVTAFNEPVQVSKDFASGKAKFMLWSSLRSMRSLANAIVE